MWTARVAFLISAGVNYTNVRFRVDIRRRSPEAFPFAKGGIPLFPPVCRRDCI